jgi:hypothetical protein
MRALRRMRARSVRSRVGHKRWRGRSARAHRVPGTRCPHTCRFRARAAAVARSRVPRNAGASRLRSHSPPHQRTAPIILSMGKPVSPTVAFANGMGGSRGRWRLALTSDLMGTGPQSLGTGGDGFVYQSRPVGAPVTSNHVRVSKSLGRGGPTGRTFPPRGSREQSSTCGQLSINELISCRNLPI